MYYEIDEIPAVVASGRLPEFRETDSPCPHCSGYGSVGIDHVPGSGKPGIRVCERCGGTGRADREAPAAE